MTLPATHPLLAHGTARSRLVRAYLGHRTDVTPVWFMRQAGRSLPEYRALRSQGSMLEACLSPELASEITLQPVRRHGVDAAIFFSDIVVPLLLAGLDVRIEPGRGPVFREPVRDAAAISAVTAIDPAVVRERADPIVAAIRRTTAMLAEVSAERGEPVPLIGFAGAPFTLAAYLVEGGPSKDHLAVRRLMQADPTAFDALAGWLAAVTGTFLAVQLEAGASAGQLFDSWAGALAPADYRAHALPASRAALDPARALRPPAEAGIDRFPLVHFGVGTGELLPDLVAAGVDTVGIDHRVPLDEAVRRVGTGVSVQGNLDPAVLFAPAEVRRRAVARVLAEGRAARAHVFNLGHGVPAETDPDVLGEIVAQVHEETV